MAKWTTSCGEGARVAFPENATFHLSVAGDLSAAFTDENIIEARFRAAYRLADLFVRSPNNNVDNPSTIRIRRNQANGNQSVSIPANTSGVFEDTVNSDVYVSGDTMATQLAIGAGAGGDTLVLNVVSYTIEDSAAPPLHLIGAARQWVMTRNQDEFSPMHGTLDGSTTENTSYRFRVASTIDRLRTFVSQNFITGSATILRTRENGANGNLSISIPATTNGEFEDTVNSDGLVSGDNMNFNMVTGSSAMGSDFIEILTVHVRVDSIARHLGCGNALVADTPVNTNRFIQMEDGLLGAAGPGIAFEVQGRQTARTPFDAQNLFVNVVTNTLDGACHYALHILSTDTALGVSVPAATSGEFEDTVNVVSLIPTDQISYHLDSNAGASGVINYNQLGLEQRQLGAGDPALPEGLQATQPIMVMRGSRG